MRPILKIVGNHVANGTVINTPPRQVSRKDQRKYLTAAEVEALIKAAARSNRHGERDALAIQTAFRHGLRVSELCDLQWSDIDLKTGTLFVRRLKGGRNSTHYLQSDEIKALRRLRQQDKTGRFVFMNERGASMTAAGFRKMLARVGEAAGPDVRAHPHMLRHACGYHLANKGKDTRSLQGYLGHVDIRHTAEYSMLAPNRFKNFWED